MNKLFSKLALCTGGFLICKFIFEVLRSMFRNNNNQCDSAIHEMLFCGEEPTRQIWIHTVIMQASSTVDVCVPSLSSDTLAQCLVNVQKKNKVHVRIAIHNSDDFHNLQLFAQNGLEVKVIRTGVRLAHEFVLLDASARDGVTTGLPLALLGALGHAAACTPLQRAATLLTSDTTVVSALHLEFERVWNSVSHLQ